MADASWREQLKFDPLEPLRGSGDEALEYFVRRDLLGEEAGPAERLWQLKEPQRILRRQERDGAWPPKEPVKHPAVNQRLIETWRWTRILVEKHGCDRRQPGLERAAEYVFSCQSEEGDIRGFLANQYATYYTGAVTGILIKAGYAGDPRVERALEWLLAMRQDDGGWTIPILTHKLGRATRYRLTSEPAEPLEPDRSKPFSHNWTGMVLRAFAEHSDYRKRSEVLVAARLLASRFFQPDSYNSLRAASYWLRFDTTFWWNNLVSALDSLSLIGLSREDDAIARALEWLVAHQRPDGLWRLDYARPQDEPRRTDKVLERERWVSLAVCRVFERFGK